MLSNAVACGYFGTIFVVLPGATTSSAGVCEPSSVAALEIAIEAAGVSAFAWVTLTLAASATGTCGASRGSAPVHMGRIWRHRHSAAPLGRGQ